MTEQRKKDIYKLFATMYVDGYGKKEAAKEKEQEKQVKSIGSVSMNLRHNPS